jgi:glycosyltransferase involved in cell wall biosynthesis
VKILSICPAVPAVNAKGYQVQAYYRLRHLSKNHRITVVCFGQGELDEVRKSALLDLGIDVRMIPWRKSVGLCQIFKAIFNRDIPLQCALFSSGYLRSLLDKVTRSTAPDLIHCTTIRMLPNLLYISLPLIVDLVDSMALNFRRRVDQAPWWIRALWKFELARVAPYERLAAEKSSASFVVSMVDRNEIRHHRIRVLPLGIDGDQYSKGVAASDPIVLLTGNMSYQPNIDAALWFASRCWPAISSANPNALFVIAGNRPSAAVRNLAINPTIRVTGNVPIMTDVIRSAQVAVAPMQSGSGMQFKILEAMACGLPVVTTSLGLGDIRAKPNSEIVIADTPTDFIDATIKLLASSELRSRLGDSGQHFVYNHHTWDSINTAFERVLIDELNFDASPASDDLMDIK